MGVETIVALIREESASESEGSARDAEADASKRIAAAEAAAARAVADAVARAAPGARSAGQRRVNSVLRRLVEKRAELAARQVDAVFAEATAWVNAIAEGADADRGGPDPAGAQSADPARAGPDVAGADRWRAALQRMARGAIAACGEESILTVRSRDAGRLSEGGMFDNGRILAVLDAPPGVVARSPDGRVEVDATLPVRLARARARLADDVARRVGVPGR